METAEQIVMATNGNFVSNGDTIEMIKIYAKNYAKSLSVFRICNHCNTEFELTVANSYTERVSAFENCTHCGKRNDTWISIKLSQPI